LAPVSGHWSGCVLIVHPVTPDDLQRLSDQCGGLWRDPDGFHDTSAEYVHVGVQVRHG
jgi:hypothetical protein